MKMFQSIIMTEINEARKKFPSVNWEVKDVIIRVPAFNDPEGFNKFLDAVEKASKKFGVTIAVSVSVVGDVPGLGRITPEEYKEVLMEANYPHLLD